MALDKFKAPRLPEPRNGQVDAAYVMQLVRAIEIYFSQLDSKAANNASKYTADDFVGGTFNGAFEGYLQKVTTAQRLALSVNEGYVVYDTDFKQIAVKTDTGWRVNGSWGGG